LGLFVLVIILEGNLPSSAQASDQLAIDYIELMPNIPQPFAMRDWKQTAKDYDAFVFDFDKKGKYLPLVWLDDAHTNFDRDGFGLPTYIGHPQMVGGSKHEAINCAAAVLSATLVGIDKSSQNGHNWVLMCEDYFNRRNGQNLFLNGTSDKTGISFWYEILPNILMFQLMNRYPQTGNFQQEMQIVADRWHQACVAMGGSVEPLSVPNFHYTAFDFAKMEPVYNGRWIEPDSAAGIAWMEYMAWVKLKQDKYLTAADWSMQFLQAKKANPLYECLIYFGAYTAARMNAELGRNFDVGKLLDWCFEPSDTRYGWGVITEKWGNCDCYGLSGSVTDGGGYAFAMNTFLMANALVPAVRYDDRYARAIGKWMLNAANAARLFYGDGLADDYQSCADWAGQYDKNRCIAYEGLRKKWNGKSPVAMGDPLAHGWAKTDFGLYGSSHVGVFGGIISPTNDEKILQLDCLKTDFYHGDAYPTYLYFNPYDVEKKISIEVGDEAKDLYDMVSNSFLQRNVKKQASFTIAPNSAVLLVLAPAGGTIKYDANKTYVDAVIVDYNNNRVVLPAAASPEPAKKSVSEPDLSTVVKADWAVIDVDGNPADWADLKSEYINLDENCRGNLKCRVKFAWDKDYLYFLVEELPGDTTMTEANSPSKYASGTWSFDGISFVIDVDNSNEWELIGDFNPWYGFSSTGQKNLFFARSHNAREFSQDGFLLSKAATTGSQANNSRVIEAAIKWKGIADNVSKSRQPGGDLTSAVKPGFRFGCDPILVDDGWRGQSFVGGCAKPSGSDIKSRDILLVGGPK
jgi:hypothetical protein